MKPLLLMLLAWIGLARANEDVDPAADAAAAAEIASAPGLDEPPLMDPPSEADAEALTKRISKGLRCPVCQGLSVADSNAEAARAMHTRIGELVRQGYTQGQIEDYFVDRYGQWVRLEPPPEGLNWIIWIGPVVVFVIGAGFIATRVRGRDEDAVAPSPLPPPAPAPAPSRDAKPAGDARSRILAELGEAAPPAAATQAEAPDYRAQVLSELEGDV